MTPERQDQINKVSNLPRIGNPKYVTIADFSTWCTSNEGIVNFSVPGTLAPITARAQSINYVSNNEFTYIGKVDGPGNSNFSIGRDDEGYTGFIILSETRYSIYPLGGNYAMIIQDGHIATDNECSTENGIITSSNDDYCTPNSDCYTLIDIVCVFNRGVSIPAGFNSMATLSINTALLNSGIINKEVRVRTMPLPSTIPTFPFPLGNPTQDRDALTSNSQMQNLRNTFGADLLVLMTGTPWTVTNSDGSTSTVFGVAHQNAQDDENKGFAIVVSSSAFGNRLTLVHEVGHLLGARHNRPPLGTDNTFDCAHGHVFEAAGFQRFTIMSNLSFFGSRIPYFSNASVDFSGVPTGVTGDGNTQAENARKIKNAACEVGIFRRPLRLHAQIKGPIELCPNDNVLFGALVVPGTGTGQQIINTYVWSVANSPNGPFTTLATNNAAVAWVHYNLGIPNNYMYLRLVVTTAAGTSFTTIKRILIHGSCLGGGEGDDRSVEEEDSDSDWYSIVPNPADSRVVFRASGDQAGIYQVRLLDLLGREVISSPYSAIPEKQIEVRAYQLPQGNYVALINSTTGMLTRTILIQH
jgi:hypothetical protein